MLRRKSTSFRNLAGLKKAKIPKIKTGELSSRRELGHQGTRSDYLAAKQSYPAKRHHLDSGYDDDDVDEGILGETFNFEDLGDQEHHLVYISHLMSYPIFERISNR